MKIYAMSDIHGYLDAFEQALENIDLSGDNMLILLGDYIHGGDESREVLERIMDLQAEYGDDKVVVLSVAKLFIRQDGVVCLQKFAHVGLVAHRLQHQRSRRKRSGFQYRYYFQAAHTGDDGAIGGNLPQPVLTHEFHSASKATRTVFPSFVQALGGNIRKHHAPSHAAF